MTLKNAVTKGVKAWRDRRVGYWLCIDPKTGEYYLLTSANLAELNGVVRIDEQDMKDILAAAPKSQRGWIRTRLGYMVVL